MVIASAIKGLKQLGKSIAMEYDRVLMALYLACVLVFLYVWMK